MDKLCEMTSIKDFDISNDKILICCSFFKLHSMYNDISAYITGLNRLTEKIVESNDMILRLYIDHSVSQDDNFVKYMDKYIESNKIQVLKYKCPNFIDASNSLHYGTFGTIIRFYPFFDKRFKNNLKFLSDIDLEPNYIAYFLDICKSKIVKSSNECTLNVQLLYSYKYSNFFKFNLINDAALCSFWLKNLVLPESMLYDGLMDINSSDFAKNFREILEKDNKKIPQQTADQNNFMYGCDEYFLNTYVLPYIANKCEKINIFYTSAKLNKYINGIDWNKTNIREMILRELLKKKYTGSIKNDIRNLRNLLDFSRVNTVSDYVKIFSTLKEFCSLLTTYQDNIIFNIPKDTILNNLKINSDKRIPCYLLYLNKPLPQEVHNFILKSITMYEVSTKSK